MSQSITTFSLLKPTKTTPFKPFLTPSFPRHLPISAVRSEPKSTSPSDNLSLTAVESQLISPIIPESSSSSSSSSSPSSVLEVDLVTSSEIKENGFRSTRRTKIVCTIGPSSCDFETIEGLARGGMNVARLNMCHNTREWHKQVIEHVRRLNDEMGFAIAILMDTQGSEIHMGDLHGASSVKAEDGSTWTFSIRSFDGSQPKRIISVSYDGFAEDVKVGDELLVDGGMVRFEVVEKIGPDIKCLCTDPGLLLPRANLALWRKGKLVQQHNKMLPTITSQDWLDIDFAIAEGVDFIALSFVRSADTINHLRSYIAARSPNRDIAVIAKIESVDSLKNLEEIIQASDGAMVARGDMGSQIPLEQVPFAQQKIVQRCRQYNKPVIVASQLLESMIEYPIPTRAEVADVSEAVRQQADALMLSGESAMGLFPDKALAVLRNVSLRIEKRCRDDNLNEELELTSISTSFPDVIKEEICFSAAKIASRLQVDALFVYTTDGHMASLLSRWRPDCPIFAFTPTSSVRKQLNLLWGLIPFRLNFSEDMDSNLSQTLSLLKLKDMIKSGDRIVAVSDMLQSIQVQTIP